MRSIVLVGVGGAVAAFVFAGCGKSESSASADSESPRISAHVEMAGVRETPSVREFSGTVRSTVSAAIQSKITGHITAVHVKAGDTVEAGAVLAEIDAREARAQVAAAESGLAVAKRTLDEVTQAIAAARSAKEAADAQRDLAATTYDRQKKLLEQQAISKQVFDEAEAAMRAAAATAQARSEELAALEAKREQANAAIEQARAALDSAKVTLSYTSVTAPFTGMITEKSAEVGDLASPGMVLFQLENKYHYRLEAVVDEAVATTVQLDAAVETIVDATGSSPMTGTVTEVVPAADPASRTFTIKIALPEHPALRTGQFGRARFSAAASRVLTVPRAALVQRGQLEGVYVVDDGGIARLRLVKSGRVMGERIEILSGLNEGERYVAETVDGLTDGARVTPR